MRVFVALFTAALFSVAPVLAESLVDLQAARTQRYGRYALHYGLRYINYSAKYPRDASADRERLVMPFVGLEVPLR